MLRVSRVCACDVGYAAEFTPRVHCRLSPQKQASITGEASPHTLWPTRPVSMSGPARIGACLRPTVMRRWSGLPGFGRVSVPTKCYPRTVLRSSRADGGHRRATSTSFVEVLKVYFLVTISCASCRENKRHAEKIKAEISRPSRLRPPVVLNQCVLSIIWVGSR